MLVRVAVECEVASKRGFLAHRLAAIELISRDL